MQITPPQSFLLISNHTEKQNCLGEKEISKGLVQSMVSLPELQQVIPKFNGHPDSLNAREQMRSLWRAPSWNFGKTYSQRWGRGCKMSLNRSAANAHGLATFTALEKERTCCVLRQSIITWEKKNKTKS